MYGFKASYGLIVHVDVCHPDAYFRKVFIFRKGHVHMGITKGLSQMHRHRFLHFLDISVCTLDLFDSNSGITP